MRNKDTAPSQAQVDKFTFLSPMLDSALSEMREFAKKKQDGIVSKMKIKILNRLLTDIKSVVQYEQSAAYLDLLSEEELPQNSDAVVVLGQYRAALDSFQKRNIAEVDFARRWITKEWIEDNESVPDEETAEDGGEDDDNQEGPDDDDALA